MLCYSQALSIYRSLVLAKRCAAISCCTGQIVAVESVCDSIPPRGHHSSFPIPRVHSLGLRNDFLVLRGCTQARSWGNRRTLSFHDRSLGQVGMRHSNPKKFQVPIIQRRSPTAGEYDFKVIASQWRSTCRLSRTELKLVLPMLVWP